MISQTIALGVRHLVLLIKSIPQGLYAEAQLGYAMLQNIVMEPSILVQLIVSNPAPFFAMQQSLQPMEQPVTYQSIAQEAVQFVLQSNFRLLGPYVEKQLVSAMFKRFAPEPPQIAQ